MTVRAFGDQSRDRAVFVSGVIELGELFFPDSAGFEGGSCASGFGHELDWGETFHAYLFAPLLFCYFAILLIC